MTAMVTGRSRRGPRAAPTTNVDQPCVRRPAQSGDGLDWPASGEPNTQAQASSTTVVVGLASRGPGRRQITVEMREVAHPLGDEELRRREQELDRLIIKAACRRAVRLAGLSSPTCVESSTPATLPG
jgi:hypothetical protein